jgi:uncharacterized protein YndB with AHSA1/START domain
MTNRTNATYDGTLQRTADGGVIRFERRLDYPIREVWDAITNPERLADWWLPSTPTLPSTCARAVRWCSPAKEMMGRSP